jgi:hypothetical protein
MATVAHVLFVCWTLGVAALVADVGAVNVRDHRAEIPAEYAIRASDQFNVAIRQYPTRARLAMRRGHKWILLEWRIFESHNLNNIRVWCVGGLVGRDAPALRRPVSKYRQHRAQAIRRGKFHVQKNVEILEIQLCFVTDFVRQSVV